MSQMVFMLLLMGALVSFGATPVDLDTTFGSGGRRTITGDFDVYNAAVLPDGKIMVVGVRFDSSTVRSVIRVQRLTAAGATDSTFGSSGVREVPIGTKSSSATAAAGQSDGKVIVAGYLTSTVNQTSDFVLLRFNSNGTLDTSFDGDGMVSAELVTGAREVARAVHVQADGKIVVAGLAEVDGKDHFFICRLTSNGSFDPAFGTNGRFIVSSPFDYNNVTAMSVYDDGRVLLGGYGGDGSAWDVVMLRCLADGTLDEDFGDSGFEIVDHAGADDFLSSLQVLPDGKILYAGSIREDENFYPNFYYVARHETNGNLDLSFGILGKTVDSVASRNQTGHLALQKDGRFLVSGLGFDSDTSNGTFLVRYNPDGRLDTTFGNGGKWLDTTPAMQGHPLLLHVRSDWKIVVLCDLTLAFSATRYLGGTIGLSIGNATIQPTVQVGFRAFGPDGTTGKVEASTDLQSWSEVKSEIFSNGYFDYTDSALGIGNSKRFYRLNSP